MHQGLGKKINPLITLISASVVKETKKQGCLTNAFPLTPLPGVIFEPTTLVNYLATFVVSRNT